jgi:murein DD-endopeptidase MepM/ murein hydrolase activator NlpD
MSSIKQQIDILTNKISECNKEIKLKNAEIEKTEKSIEKNTALYKERVCTMYEVGQVSRISLLLSSKDVKEFLSCYEILKIVQQHDSSLISSLENDKNNLITYKESLEKRKNQLDENISQLNSKKEKFEQQDSQVSTLYKQLKNKNSELQQRIDDLDMAEKEASDRLSEIIRQKEEEARKKAEASGGSHNYVGGGWLFPIQNISCYISSPFGPRAGHKVPHSGIDIAAAGISGHPILAANSGTVIIAGYDSSGIYGNYVVIDHGGGISSLYGHAQSLNTTVGSQVKKGDVIAFVGNTGNVVSLGGGGYHLHFEIRENTTAVNPTGYVSIP